MQRAWTWNMKHEREHTSSFGMRQPQQEFIVSKPNDSMTQSLWWLHIQVRGADSKQSIGKDSIAIDYANCETLSVECAIKLIDHAED